MAQKDYKQEIIEKVKENYLSVALGILVFLVAVTLIFKSGDKQQPAKDSSQSQEQKEKTYVVQKGESVSSIARDQLGSMDYTQAIVDANNMKNPNSLEAGQTIVLPNVEGMKTGDTKGEVMKAEPTEAMQVKPTTAPQTISITGNTYTVQKGDYLFDIAKRAYGDGNKYHLLITANKLRRPNHLEAGTVLKIPRDATK